MTGIHLCHSNLLQSLTESMSMAFLLDFKKHKASRINPKVTKVKDQEDQTAHRVHFLLMLHTLYSSTGVSLAQKLQRSGSSVSSLNRIWSSI